MRIKLFFLFLSFLLISSANAGWFGPSLSKAQKEWKIFHGRAFSKELKIFYGVDNGAGLTRYKTGRSKARQYPPTLAELGAFGYTDPRIAQLQDLVDEIYGAEEKVKVLEDGYKMIKAYTHKKRIVKNSEIIEKELVYWGWKYKVKNISKKPICIRVEYRLKDKDEFVITSDIAKSGRIDPGEEYTIRDTGTFDYSDLERVYTSSWSIWYQEEPFL